MVAFRWSSDPWSSFFDMTRIQDEMDRFFGAVERAVGLRSVPRGTFPTMNVYEESDSVLVTAEVPGVQASELDLNITGDVMTLRGERSPPEIGEKQTVHRQERAFGKFVRSLSLPVPVDPESTEATYENGVLKVRMMKAAVARPKRITVKSNS
ncbi:MAG: Hsp20/alpha crystallin family protein [Planctomycetota bacterium]